LKYVYFEILIIGAIIPSFVWKFTKGKLSLFNYLDGHFMKSKIPVVVILFLWSTFVLSGQVQIKFDTIYCIGNTLQQVRDNITVVKFDNYDDISYKFQFKINRIKVPENADIIFFDEHSHYDRNIESCNGYPFSGGTIGKNASCTSIFGLYDIWNDEFADLPWIFSGDLYRFPGCDSLLTRVVIKIDKPKNHDSGVPLHAVWTYKPAVNSGSNHLWRVYVVRDTLIDSEAFSVIAIDKGAGPIQESAIPVMLKDGVWYFYENGQIRPFLGKSLYDYNTRQMKYFLPSVFPHYDITSDQGNTIPDTTLYTGIHERWEESYFLSDGRYYDFSDFKPKGNHNHHWKGLIRELASQNGFFGAFNDLEPNEENGILISYNNYQFTHHYTDLYCGFISNVDDEKTESDINIFPNPADQYFTFTGIEETESLYLFDIYGNYVLEFFPEQKTLDISNLSAGVYIVSFLLKNKKTIQKRLIVTK
jgi:hypothetical protein